MMKVSKIIFLMGLPLFTGLFLGTSCKNEVDYRDIPNIYTDTTIDVMSELNHSADFQFHRLYDIGGWAYIPSGYKGIFIYHVTMGEFVAFERCCTFDPYEKATKVYYNEKTGWLTDSICGTEYWPSNGMPRKGSLTERPLRPYKTTYYEYGISRNLRIVNY